MGLCLSKEEQEQAHVNQAINHQLKETQKEHASDIKMLLLGSGNSGKSTVLKQMKLIHHNGFSHEEQTTSRDAIYTNIITAIKALLSAMENYKIDFENEQNIKNKEIVNGLGYEIEASKPPTEVMNAIIMLWNDYGVKKCLLHSSEFQLDDCAKYFLDRLDRISQDVYAPTDEDILHCRIRTLGVVETSFKIMNRMYHLYDVGGQRSERRKWIQCFDNVNAVIFIVSLSDYDTRLFEDQNTNSMHESMKLFKEIANSRWFANTPMILFLNKKDIFEEKIKHSSLAALFPEYTGGDDYYKASEFIKWQYISLNSSVERQIYPHFTCATDKDAMKFVMESVLHIIAQKNLEEIGLL